MTDWEETIRTAYASLEVAPELLDPQVEWQTNWPGLAPAVHGVAGVRRWVEAFLEPWEWVRFDVMDVVEVDAETIYVANSVEARGKESGVEVQMETHDVLTIRDGRIVLRRTWTEPGPARQAAGLEA